MSNNDPEGYWGGDVGRFYNEEQWDAWFLSYERVILNFAKLSEEAGVDYLIMVSELDSTTSREKTMEGFDCQSSYCVPWRN